MEYINYLIELNQRIRDLETNQSCLVDNLVNGKVSHSNFKKQSKYELINALKVFKSSIKHFAQQEFKQFLIEQIKNSKVKDKPTHYKVFTSFVNGLTFNGLEVSTYQSDYGYSRFYIHSSKFDGVEISLYLTNNKTISWDDINNKRVDLPTLPPKELEKKFFERLAEKNKLVAEIEEKLTNFNNEWDRVGYFTKERLSSLLKSDFI